MEQRSRTVKEVQPKRNNEVGQLSGTVNWKNNGGTVKVEQSSRTVMVEQ